MKRKHFFYITILFLIWRGYLFLASFTADKLLLYAPTFPYFDIDLPQYSLPRWIYSWANFDGVHYLTIAQKGYIGTGLIQAFFPLLPYVLLRSLFLLSGGHLNTLLTGLIITNGAFLAALVIWYAFTK